MPVAGRRRAANLLRGPGARTLGTTQHSWARDHGATARNPGNPSRNDHCAALGRSTDRHLLLDAANPGLRQVLLRRGAGARLVLRARFPARAPSRTCPYCGVITVKSKAHCPKGCEWRRCLACCLPYSVTTVLR